MPFAIFTLEWNGACESSCEDEACCRSQSSFPGSLLIGPLWGVSLGTRLPISKLGSLVCCEYFQSQVSEFKIQRERRKRSFFVRYWTVQKNTTQFSNNLSLNYWSIYVVQSTECTLIISGVLKRIPKNCEKNNSGRLQYNFFFQGIITRVNQGRR